MRACSTCISSALICAVTLSASANPTVPDLLTQYRATQEKGKSCILKSTTTETWNNSFSGEYKWVPKNLSGEREFFKSSEFRFDGDRYSLRLEEWGDVRPGDFPVSLSESNKAYSSFLYTGRDSYQYRETPNPDRSRDRVVLTNGEKRIRNDALVGGLYPGQAAFGYLGYDGNRLDVILETAPGASVREELEPVNGSPCYVVEASTKHGQYTVWLDPEHGYNIAKAKVVRREGDIWFGDTYVVEPGVEHVATLDVTRFEEIEGTWVPMEYVAAKNQDYANGDFGKSTVHHKVTDVLLNPDHDALGSFLPDDIKDGALVLVRGLSQLRYTWQDGKLIPEIDEDTLDDIDDEIAKLTKDITTKETPEAASETAAPLSLSELLAQYRSTKQRIGAFTAAGKATVRELKAATDSNEISNVAFDLKRIRCRVEYPEGSASPDKTTYKSLLWDGTSVIEYVKSEAPRGDMVFVTPDGESGYGQLAAGYRGAALLGLCPRERGFIDTLIENAGAVVQERPVQIGGGTCYIVDAQTAEAMCSVWFDSSHGFNIAQIKVIRPEGLFVLENVHFSDMDGVWVPMNGDMRLTETDSGEITEWHYAHTEIDLNPDLSDPGAFEPDDIPNGTKASVTGATGEYSWKDGEPVKG